jgi:RHS repeat-associated protein
MNIEKYSFRRNSEFDSRYKFTAKELDNETNYTYFGARYYDSDISLWLSVDPLSNKYPSLSPYAYCANNPVILVDPDGREIDLSNLSDSERAAYNARIEKLSSNKLFNSYYNRLSNSETTYYIMPGSGAGGSGSYDPQTNIIHAIDNLEVLAQELFHAYQEDLGVYNSNDRSVREAEGDLVSSNIALSLGGLANANPWDQGIGFIYVDEFINFNESVLTSAFDIDFNKAVDARINFYKTRQRDEGAVAPKGYIQKNSGVGALALKKLIREVNADQNMVGPRLSNGDFYTN